MTDYNSLKVPDLKRLLGERSLPISGNKSDLIARLQENDKKPPNGTNAPAASADDEIDWDEDDSKVTTAPAAAAIAAGGKGPVAAPVVVPNQIPDVDPATTRDLKVAEPKDASTPAEIVVSVDAPSEKTAPAPVAEEAPKQDFAMGIKQTDAENEAEKRAARAKRFGITEDEEEKKKSERGKKFGTDKEVVVRGLDDALPERKAKRGRDGEKQGGRAAKRQTPDRRTEVSAKTVPAKSASTKAKPVPAKEAPAPVKKTSGRVTDDPAEKAKAEARAKRFQTTA